MKKPLSSPLPLWRSVATILYALFAAGLCWQGRSFNEASQSGIELTLPYRCGTFWGWDEQASEAEKRILPEDTQLVRKSYDATNGDQIQLSIVLSGGEKRSIHQPEQCLPAQGWTVQRREVTEISLDGGAKLPVMRLDLSREVAIGLNQRRTIRAYFLYWFVGKDKTTPSHWTRVFYTSWDRVFHRTNHRWAYVSAMAVVSGDTAPYGKTPEQTLEMLKKFLAEAAPKFHHPGVLPHP